MTVDELTVRRQNLRDQIWQHGPEQLKMETWGTDGAFDCWDVCQVVRYVDLDQCGTAACLAGHGALVIGAASRSMCDSDIADHFGLSTDAFHNIEPYTKMGWHYVQVGDETLADIYRRTGSEWETVIAYLDYLIKTA